MAYQTTSEINFASIGLITDVPSHAIPQGAWSDCLNMRIKDGSVQGVQEFVQSFTTHPDYPDAEVVAVTQWTPAGSNFLNIAYIIKDTSDSNRGRVFVYNTETEVTVEITNANEDARFFVDSQYPPQLFVFNSVLIVNPATGIPQYISAGPETAGNLADIPNWLEYAGGVKCVCRILRPYKNRLIAMSFVNSNGTEDNFTDDSFFPIDLAWSSNIINLDTLIGVEWQASTTNTAGDAFLTQTPGAIVDGGQLGEYFIAYKTDAVIRVRETGDSFVLGFDSIFEDDGIYSTRCFANIGNAQHLVIGNYGVYIHDGQSQRLDIAKGKFQDALYSLVDSDNKNLSFVCQQTRDKEVWFCFKETGSTGSGCTKAFVYNYDNQTVHIRTLPNLYDIYETEINGSLIIVAGHASNNVYELSNTLIADGYFVRTADSLELSPLVKDINKVYIEGKGSMLISLVASNTINEVIDFDAHDKTFIPATGYKLDIRQAGRYFNLRVKMDDTTNPQLTTLQFNIRTPSGR
jgi:hypothetical protein